MQGCTALRSPPPLYGLFNSFVRCVQGMPAGRAHQPAGSPSVHLFSGQLGFCWPSWEAQPVPSRSGDLCVQHHRSLHASGACFRDGDALQPGTPHMLHKFTMLQASAVIRKSACATGSGGRPDVMACCTGIWGGQLHGARHRAAASPHHLDIGLPGHSGTLVTGWAHTAFCWYIYLAYTSTVFH